MTPEQIGFLEQIARSSDSKPWVGIFQTLIEEIKDDVLAKKISVDAGNEAILKLRDVVNKIAVLNQPSVDGRKNPAI